MNINRDYLIINDVKKSNIKLDNGSMFFYITDKNTQNIFVNLVINVSNNDLIQKYANIENAEDYTLTMNIVKPDNTYKIVEGKLHDKEKAIFEFNLKEDCVDKIGTYKCELLTKCNINDHEEITTSNKLTYKVKSSVLNDLDDIVEAPEYPLVIQLFDKLSDIEQYEEDRRANELARQLAEEQRQTRFNTLDADMVDRVNAMDNKMDDVEARISAKEQAVDKLIVDTKKDIDDYKVAKGQEIDDYKTAKDAEINNAITVQDNKIDEAITNQNKTINDAVANQNNKIDTAVAEQNNRIGIVEDSDNTQNTRLDALEAKDIAHETSITNIEAKNVEQDNRLDIAENRLDNIGEDIRNTIQPTIDAQNSRLDSIEAVNVSQDNRLDAIEIKNQQQDDRLLDIEKVNNKQDIDIKCLYGASQTIDITKEGNSIYLQNSNNGFAIIDEIQGQTLVNCNKEPDKEIILNGNINTQGYSNVTLTEGVDGGLVDVALEGNTMVNVCDQKDSVALPFNRELTYLYANTLYAVQFVSDAVSKVDVTLGGAKLLNQNVAVGTNKYMTTTPSELINNNLVLNGEGFNASNIVVTEATDQDFGYFEGMKSVGECEDLEVVSENCYNYFDKDNVTTNGADNISNDFIEVNEGEQWTALSSSSDGWLKFAIFDENKNSLGDMGNAQSSKVTITIPMGVKYIKGIFSSLGMNNAMVVKGDRVLPYESYKPHAHNTQTLQHEPLRSTRDVKDKYVLIDGKWYIERNCGEVVLDGSDDEKWDIHGELKGDTSNTWVFCCKLNPYGYTNYNYYPIYNDKLKTINPRYDYNKEMIYGNKYSYYNLWIHLFSETFGATKNTPKQEALNLFKQYMQQNPLKIVGQLQTPTYELIDYNPFTVYSEVTHISNNSTIPCNMTIKNTGYNCLLKPSTTYTVSSNLGLNTVTTPSTLTEDCLRFYDTDTSTVTTMNNVMVLEGDYTTGKPIPGHFSGIESAFEQEYDEAVGKYKVKIRVQNEDASKENYIEFYIDEPLRGIRDVEDKVYVKNDKVVVQRNCGSVTFDGSDNEGWFLTSNPSTNTTRFRINVVPKCYGGLSGYCDKFKVLANTNQINMESIFLGNAFTVRILNSKLQTQDVAGFKQWLQQNPTTVVYQLAEPTYEEVEYNDVKLFIESFKNSTLFYNSNIPVTSKVWYSYSIPIVDTVAQTANVTDQQDSMIIDLATQCAIMEMYLM